MNLTHDPNVTRLLVDWEKVPRESKLEAFLLFHEQNPQVFNLFVRYGRELRGRGSLRSNSARRILDRVRWDGVYVWEHFSPYYARLMAMTYPREFGGDFFAYRTSPADDLRDVIVRITNPQVDIVFVKTKEAAA